MLDRLTSMAVFVQAAQTGSFAAAADKLGMSPQMVAKHIAALERHLATRLLNRTTRKQSLTEFGRAYLERCQTVLAEVNAADALAQAVQLRPQGRLRINAPVTFGRHGLMPMVTRFLRDFPEVELELTLSDRLVDPIEEGYEAIVRIGPIGENLALVARPLKPYRLVTCASPAYLSEHGTPLKPADLADHECVGFAPWPADLNRQWRFHKGGRDIEATVGSRLLINDWGAIHSAALDGFGIVLGSEHAVAEDLAAGRLVRVLPDFDGPVRPMHLLYAADRRMTSKLRCFIDRMIEAFGDSHR
ncbi:LysR family transcriptional regulator [Caballeronia sp. dw_276]|uniref:LysR family transcriptional regulator n=1 Tax=Caballeronia sp. dw_276 TaxID=2719795 RepID=UPI001BD653A4|nr:LysR family transcriptional regulator [Caballeronia sp. dw_276]